VPSVFRPTLRYEVIKSLELRDGPDCFYCGQIFSIDRPGAQRTLDHYMPRSLGGSNEPKNLRLACYSCNHAKADMTGDEFCNSIWLETKRKSVLESRLRKIGIRLDGRGYFHPKKNIKRVTPVGKRVRLSCTKCKSISSEEQPLWNFPCIQFKHAVA
jgi:hypothetical protein